MLGATEQPESEREAKVASKLQKRLSLTGFQFGHDGDHPCKISVAKLLWQPAY